MIFSEKARDYCFALCVVLLITFQFWYGAPHISFYEDDEELSKSHLYVGSSSMPAGWTIYMCSKEKTNHMLYNVTVIENSKVWTRTIFGNASRMPIPTINKSPSGGLLSYVLSRSQMEILENNPKIEQVFVEPLMHCLEPVKSCSKNTKNHKLVTNDIQCLAIANPNNYEINVEFMINFYVTNVYGYSDNNIIDNDDDNILLSDVLHDQMSYDDDEEEDDDNDEFFNSKINDHNNNNNDNDNDNNNTIIKEHKEQQMEKQKPKKHHHHHHHHHQKQQHHQQHHNNQHNQHHNNLHHQHHQHHQHHHQQHHQYKKNKNNKNDHHHHQQQEKEVDQEKNRKQQQQKQKQQQVDSIDNNDNDDNQERIYNEIKNISTKKSQIFIDVASSVFSIILKSGV